MYGDMIKLPMAGKEETFSVEMESNFGDKESGHQLTVTMAQSLRNPDTWVIKLPGQDWITCSKGQCLNVFRSYLNNSL